MKNVMFLGIYRKRLESRLRRLIGKNQNTVTRLRPITIMGIGFFVLALASISLISNFAEANEPNIASELSSDNPTDQAVEPNEQAAFPANNAASKRATLTGRFVLPNDEPAAGVQVTVSGCIGNSSRVMKYPIPEWKDIQKTTDSDGRFLIELDDPPRAYQFFMEAKHHGFVLVNWRWAEIPYGAAKDLGTIKLKRGGTVEGRILNSSGEPINGTSSVYATSSYQPDGDGGDQTCGYASADHVTGAFRINNLPPGSIQLKLNTELNNWVLGPTVEVKESEITRADILYDGPDLSKRITVVIFNRFPKDTDPKHGTLLLRDSDGLERLFEKIPSSSQSYFVDGLAPGKYELLLKDPRFMTVVKKGIRPGTKNEITCMGNAAVQLNVLDDATDTQIESYELRVRFDKSNWSPNVFRVRAPGATMPKGRIYNKLIPIHQTLIVYADGYAVGEQTLENLAANEVRTVNIRLTKGTRVIGKVRQSSQPLSGLKVKLAPTGYNFDISDNLSNTIRTTRTGPDGTFTFDNVKDGAFDLFAVKSPSIWSIASNVVISGTAENIVNIDLPSEGGLQGRILGPQGAQFGGLTLTLGRMSYDETEAVLNKDGEFHFNSVLPGKLKVFLQTRKNLIRTANLTISTGYPLASSIEIGQVDVVAGKLTNVEFDMRNNFPGDFFITTRVNGQLRDDIVLEALQAGTDNVAVGGGLKGAESAHFGPVPTGVWRIAVRPIIGTWRYLLPTPVAINPAGAAKVTVDVALRKGSILVKNAASGEPIPNHCIDLHIAKWPWRTTMVTDKNGIIEVVLPEGTYLLKTSLDQPGKHVRAMYRNGDVHFSQNNLDLDSTELDWTGPTLPTSIEIK